MYFKANCIVLGSFTVWFRAPKPAVLAGAGWPNVGATNAPTGGYKFVWFGMLKTSQRNSTCCLSAIWKSLDSAVLTMIEPGPNRLLFFKLPKV